MKITKQEKKYLLTTDYIIGTIIAVILICLWIYLSSGLSLIATFIPGMAFAWILYSILYFKKIEIPDIMKFLPLYLLTLGVQFIHFTEEFIMNFKELFPALYGGSPYTNNLFVSFNMVSYFIFIVSPLLVYYKKLRFMLLPMLFFIVYGALGNAISHTWWSIYLKGYFPGFFTALIYWILAPILINLFLKSPKNTGIFIGIMTGILIVTVTFFIN